MLKSRKEKRDLADSMNKLTPKPKELKSIYIDDKNLNDLTVSPDGRFVTYRLANKTPTDIKNTIVPNYVTENGFTQDIPGREKVGQSAQASYESFCFRYELQDTVIAVKNRTVDPRHYR